MSEWIQKLGLAIPPLLTFALIEWGHISSIVVFYQNGIVQLVFINILYALLMASFIQLMRTNAGTVSREPLNTYTVRYDNGETRFCRHCDQLKPDRAHHCSICNTCILRQDHHCPWIYNCVGYYTHKLFILFTFYGFLYCFVLFLTLLSAYSVFSRSVIDLQLELNTFMALVASGLFAVALFMFAILHLSYALRNITSMDSMGFPRTRFSHRNDLNIFRKSYLENFKMFMGDDVNYWWLPTVPKFHSDGYEYHLNDEASRLLETQAAGEET